VHILLVLLPGNQDPGDYDGEGKAYGHGSIDPLDIPLPSILPLLLHCTVNVFRWIRKDFLGFQRILKNLCYVFVIKIEVCL
jgi:hypothetical protein